MKTKKLSKRKRRIRRAHTHTDEIAVALRYCFDWWSTVLCPSSRLGLALFSSPSTHHNRPPKVIVRFRCRRCTCHHPYRRCDHFSASFPHQLLDCFFHHQNALLPKITRWSVHITRSRSLRNEQIFSSF